MFELNPESKAYIRATPNFPTLKTQSHWLQHYGIPDYEIIEAEGIGLEDEEKHFRDMISTPEMLKWGTLVIPALEVLPASWGYPSTS